MNAAVLLVDDDRALRKLVRAYLHEEGIGVLECGSGEEAVELARERRPSLVLLDVRLPGIDGFEVLRRFEAAGLALPVIMLTSLSDEVDQLVGFRLGAVDYVTKPVSPKLLAAKVKAFLTRVAGHEGAHGVPRSGRWSSSTTPTACSSRAARSRSRDGSSTCWPRSRSIPAGSTTAITSCSACGATRVRMWRRASSTSTSRTSGASSRRQARTACWRPCAVWATDSSRAILTVPRHSPHGVWTGRL